MTSQHTFQKLESGEDAEFLPPNPQPRKQTASVAVGQKCCFKCGDVKLISEFYAHPQMADGHLGKCISCAKRDARAREEIKRQDPQWLNQERERCRLKQEQYRKAGTAAPTKPETREKWELKNQHKRRAEVKAAAAKKKGALVAPKNCEDCGNVGIELEMHHDDYSKPLDVKWLCTKCHGKTRRLRA